MAFEIITTTAQPVIVIRRKTQLGSPEMHQAIDSGYQALWGHLAQHAAAPAGAPLLWTHDMSNGTIEFDLGIPVSGPLPEGDEIRNATLPAGQAATTIHEGSYEHLEDSYRALQTWIADQGKQVTGGPWEVYLTDPSQTPDVKDWRTQLFMPVG